MADPDREPVSPLRRPTLLLAIVGSAIALGLGLAGTDERALLTPAVVTLLWVAAYRAQANESARFGETGRRAGAVVVRRNEPSPARQRRLMPPTPSRLSPAAAVAASGEKSNKGADDRPRVKPVTYGIPEKPTGEAKQKRRVRGKRRGKPGGDPTLGL
jgi:hypothetical protein